MDYGKEIGELFGKIEVGFQSVNERLDKIDERLEAIEKNNTNLKLTSQKNTISINNLEEKLNSHIKNSMQKVKENRNLFYARAKLVLAILGLVSGGWWIKVIVDAIIK